MLQFSVMLNSERLVALDTGGRGVLLLFRKHATHEDLPTGGGLVPGHGGEGQLHLAFAIASEDYASWKDRLQQNGVTIRSEVTWSKGGRSIYFDDPAANVVELATPGLWSNY